MRYIRWCCLCFELLSTIFDLSRLVMSLAMNICDSSRSHWFEVNQCSRLQSTSFYLISTTNANMKYFIVICYVLIRSCSVSLHCAWRRVQETDLVCGNILFEWTSSIRLAAADAAKEWEINFFAYRRFWLDDDDKWKCTFIAWNELFVHRRALPHWQAAGMRRTNCACAVIKFAQLRAVHAFNGGVAAFATRHNYNHFKMSV